MKLLTAEELENLSIDEKKHYLNLLKKREKAKKYNRMAYFKPYDFQKEFFDKGKEVPVRALIAANRC